MLPNSFQMLGRLLNDHGVRIQITQGKQPWAEPWAASQPPAARGWTSRPAPLEGLGKHSQLPLKFQNSHTQGTKTASQGQELYSRIQDRTNRNPSKEYDQAPMKSRWVSSYLISYENRTWCSSEENNRTGSSCNNSFNVYHTVCFLNKILDSQGNRKMQIIIKRKNNSCQLRTTPRQPGCWNERIWN